MKLKNKEKPVSAPPQDGFSLISNAKLLELYFTMLKCRMIEERAGTILKQGNNAASSREEALAVGTTIGLVHGDTLTPKPGDLIPLFINGLPLAALLQNFASPIELPTNPPSRIKLATAAAIANKLKGNRKISLLFSPRNSAPSAAWQQALSVAGRRQLPMIFVSTNDTAFKTQVYGFPAIPVDGNDVVAIYRVACEAIALARNGSGPTLIDCQTRHSIGEDPIQNMEKYLRQKGLFDEQAKATEVRQFMEELDAATHATLLVSSK
jgi:pyruvate dehydrogenase E1 component alpha subunit